MKKELVNLSNNYIANIGVSYIKLHNLHWNVVGHQFKAVHEYLESLYDALAAVLDEVAEILKMDGEMPLGSLKKYLEAASIEELEDKDYSVQESLEIVLKDLELLKDRRRPSASWQTRKIITDWWVPWKTSWATTARTFGSSRPCSSKSTSYLILPFSSLNVYPIRKARRTQSTLGFSARTGISVFVLLKHGIVSAEKYPPHS